jgi:DNA repair ATPase RecN
MPHPRGFFDTNNPVVRSHNVRYNANMQSGIIDKNRTDDMDERYHLVMHEQTDRKLDAIMEYVQDIPEIKYRVTNLETRMDHVEIKLDAISFVVKEHSTDLQSINSRLDTLESVAKDHTKDLRHLKAAVKQNGLDIRQNTMDIKQNSADIQALKTQLAA